MALRDKCSVVILLIVCPLNVHPFASRCIGDRLCQKHLEVLPSTGITRASTVILPCPTPADAAARSDVEAATLAPTGLPRLPEPPFQRAVPTTPADRAGAYVVCVPASRSLPQMAGGSASALSLSRCYGAIR